MPRMGAQQSEKLHSDWTSRVSPSRVAHGAMRSQHARSTNADSNWHPQPFGARGKVHAAWPSSRVEQGTRVPFALSKQSVGHVRYRCAAASVRTALRHCVQSVRQNQCLKELEYVG